MSTESHFLAEARGIVARYLAGDESFDAAAHRLASLVKNAETHEATPPTVGQPVRSPRSLLLARLTVTVRSGSEPPVTSVLRSVPFAPELSPEAANRALSVIEAGFRLANPGDDAA